MKGLLQLLPLIPPVLLVVMLTWLLLEMHSMTHPAYQPRSSTPKFSLNVSFTTRIIRFLAWATAAVAALRPVCPGLWLDISAQIVAIRTQLAGRDGLPDSFFPLRPGYYLPHGHEPTAPMNAVNLHYTVSALVDVTAVPGESTQCWGAEVEYRHNLPDDPWRDGDQLTAEGINAILLGFANGLMCTIRIAEEQGVDGAALLREAISHMEQVFIAQVDEFSPVQPLTNQPNQ